jgi:hypothetical protein
LKAAAGDHLERFIPQIYSLDEYTPVIAMGFQVSIGVQSGPPIGAQKGPR